ncbi:hypothetical protein JW926_17930 [Candidatus Sumerlaeota bacterium]|nr:hypothetical protein [Candidatus Sumerlaeota bacterium]
MKFKKTAVVSLFLFFVLTGTVNIVSGQEIWFKLNPDALPPERAAFGMIYDRISERPIIFGGFNSEGEALNDTWAFQGNEWVPIKSFTEPAARYFPTFTYNPNNDTGILVAGFTETDLLTDAWEYHDGNWRLLTSMALPGRHSHAAAFDPVANALLIHGGIGNNNEQLSDFWAFYPDEGDGIWDEIPVVDGPGPLYGHAMAYDAYHNQIVLFGGADELNKRHNETWIYKNGIWSMVATEHAPSPRINHKMTWDQENRQIALFGGYEEYKRLNDLWIFNGEDWLPMETIIAPSERSAHEMIYDSTTNRINCMGGIGTTNDYFNDMWILYKLSIKFDKETYASIHDRAIIKVVDLSSNLNPNAIDTISVIVMSDTDPVGISLTISETAINTGIFTNDSIDDQLKFSLIESNQDLRIIRISDGDTVSAIYTSPSEAGELTDTAIWNGIDSVLIWDKPVYIGYYDKAVLTVFNQDANFNPNAIETIPVKVTSDYNPDGIDVILTELSEESGVFTFTKGTDGLIFSPKYSIPGWNQIAVRDRDTLRMTYQNPYDGTIHTSSALWIRSFISMEFDKDLYIGNETANFVLKDPDLNLNPELSETVWIQYTSDSDPVGIGIPAYETGPNTGIFDPGPLGFNTSYTSYSQRKIKVTDGDVITMTHGKYLETPVYATTKWMKDDPPLKDRPAVFILLGPKEDAITSETIITFHFTAAGESLGDINPREVEFKTKLLDYEKEWTPWIQGTTRTYENLPAGEYTFFVQCRDPEGLVSVPVFRHFYVAREEQGPLVPPELVAAPGDNFIYLQWDHLFRENLLGYFIYKREEGKNVICLNSLPLDPMSSDYTDGPIIQHRRYEYFVRAVSKDGRIKDSNKVWCSATKDVPGNDVLVFTEEIIDLGISSNEAKLEVYNRNVTEPIYWTLYTDTPALRIFPASGISQGGAINVNIYLDRKDFSPGVHELMIHVRSTAASYLPPSVNTYKAIRVRFSIPGDVVHIYNTVWTKLRLDRDYYEGVWVDLTSQFYETPSKESAYGVMVFCPLDDDWTVDMTNPFDLEDGDWRIPYFDLGVWNMSVVGDGAPHSIFEGNRNGQIDAGENVSIIINEWNQGKIGIRSATIIYYSTEEFVEILTPNYRIINNLAGEYVASMTCNFRVSESIPDIEGGYPFTIYGIIVDSDGYSWSIKFDLKALKHPMRFTHEIDDDILGYSSGNDNGIIESEENIEIPVTTHNLGENAFPQMNYFLDEITSPVAPITFARPSFKSDYPVPPKTSQNVGTDFEFHIGFDYAGEQLNFRLSSAFINPIFTDQFSLPSNYLSHTGSFFAHPDKIDEDTGEPIMCPAFRFAYSYLQEKYFAENLQEIVEREAAFDNDMDGWISHLDNPPYSSPEAGVTEESLYLKSLNNADCHGFWESPQDYAPIIPDSLYRVRSLLHSDQEDASLAPTFRMRAFDDMGGQADILVVSSEGSGVCAPGTKPRLYDLYFTPNQETGSALRLAWDIINFNPNDAPQGTLYLDNIIIDRINLLTMPTPLRFLEYGFFDDAEGWKYSTIPDFFTPAIGYHTNGILQITGIDNNSFGCWENPRYDIVQGENLRLYCAEITARTDFDTDQDQVPQVRLRINASNNQYAILKNINSEGTGKNSLDIENKRYKIFCYSPIDEDGNPAMDVPLQIFIDYINFNAADSPSATVKIEEVTVDIYPPDTMP